MTYDEVVKKFLEGVAKIKSLNPAYKQPGDGSDGTCDCIGLIIGAIRRMGLKWTGIHGTNWAARREYVILKKISSVNDLELGDVVLKARQPGDSKYDLPARYKKGGKYYNGDLLDYYHAGVVTSLNPLNITHMSAGITVDKKLGQWKYGGRMKILQNAASGETTPATPGTPTTGTKAIVVSLNGLPVKMRQYPSASCRTWVKVPSGTEVEIVMPGDGWSQINSGNKKGWYMMSGFLDIIGDGKGLY